MIGIIAGLTQLIGSLVLSYNMDSITQENRKKAIEDGRQFYFDSRGKMFMISLDKKDVECYEKWDLQTGHRVVVTAKTKSIIKDYDLEKQMDAEAEFHKAYKEAKEKAIREGRKYFHPLGCEGLDKRYGYYELSTERLISLSKCAGFYHKTYWKIENGRYVVDGTKSITREEYEELGGDFTHFDWEGKWIRKGL